MIHFDNTAPVKLKGAGGGFWIAIDPSHPEAVLITEISKLIKNLKHLAINADVTLDVGDARGHGELLRNIKAHLEANFELGRIVISPQKRSAPTQRIRQRDLSRGWSHHRSDVLMLRGRVRSGQKINARKHLVITGDVNPGAEITAGGDIIVLGKLAGKAHAGSPENQDAIIFALAFAPSHVKIGGISATGSEETLAQQPEFACVEDRCIVVKDYMKASPFRRLPWPETV